MRASIIALLVSTATIVAACTGYDDEDDPCIDTGTCPPRAPSLDAGDASLDAGTFDAIPDHPDAGCDLSVSPREAPCIITENNGMFVTASGDDASADGTKAKPFGSIGAASVAAMTSGKPRVFVCAGVWSTAAQLSTTSDGVSVYGGFACDTWTNDAAANHTIVAPPTGTALSIAQIAKGITIEDVDFVAANAASPSESSIAVQVTNSQHVTFRRVTMTAGAGADGVNGTTPTVPLDTPTKGNNAADAPAFAGGAAVTCACPNGVSSIGAKGGSGGVTATDGETGQPALSSNRGLAGSPCTKGIEGTGAPATPDEAGAGKPGAFVAGAWTPTNGGTGKVGATGQGGGGGGGELGVGNGGGSGGCGGCGGAGGGGGGGGGASIALLVAGSDDVALLACKLQSAKGGAGGAGAPGQAGAAGAAKGNSSGTGSGCQGGAGGAGAAGGAGGGGAGGLSTAIAANGKAPSVDGTTTLSPGVGGAGGVGGHAGANDGIAGPSAPTFPVP